ncbi:hypothetical protein [Delftia acidovorans]|uniref:hypothetical protein n=1 Tax=Delftia acidovorans TaxID=80866 RepID=UPI0012FE0D37|nr:hypothetical protein [Delftia acidovorans]
MLPKRLGLCVSHLVELLPSHRISYTCLVSGVHAVTFNAACLLAEEKRACWPFGFLSSIFIAEPVLAQSAFFAARARAIPLSEVGFAPAARVAACCLVALLLVVARGILKNGHEELLGYQKPRSAPEV